MADDQNFDPAADRERNLHRHGEPDPKQWDEAETVTQRPNDLVKDKVVNSTFGDRAKAQKSATDAPTKAIEPERARNKAVKSARAAKK